MKEYRDYRTDKIITREEYIANGLSRGELLIKEECGCLVIEDRTAGAYIVYCYQHDAAPVMYEALKSAYAWYYRGATGDYRLIGVQIKAALEKVEGKEYK